MVAGSRVANELRSEHAIGAPSNRWRCVFPLLSGDFDALILGCREASRLVWRWGEGRGEQFAEIAAELRCPALLMKRSNSRPMSAFDP
jgi:hypothetical protein